MERDAVEEERSECTVHCMAASALQRDNKHALLNHGGQTALSGEQLASIEEQKRKKERKKSNSNQIQNSFRIGGV